MQLDKRSWCLWELAISSENTLVYMRVEEGLVKAVEECAFRDSCKASKSVAKGLYLKTFHVSSLSVLGICAKIRQIGYKQLVRQATYEEWMGDGW
jgi:hypothetical protein